MKRIRIISFALAAVILFFSQTRISNYKIVASLEFTLIRKVIVLDAGHGGPDGGAVGGKDIVEKILRLRLQRRCKIIYKNKVR